MKRHRIFATPVLAIALAAAALAAPSVVINNTNPDAPDEKVLTAILTGKQKFWENGNEVLIGFVKADSAAEQKLKDLIGMNLSRFKNHWQRLAFSGRGRMPKQFDTREELLDFIRSNDGAIGVVGEIATGDIVKAIN